MSVTLLICNVTPFHCSFLMLVDGRVASYRPSVLSNYGLIIFKALNFARKQQNCGTSFTKYI